MGAGHVVMVIVGLGPFAGMETEIFACAAVVWPVCAL